MDNKKDKSPSSPLSGIYSALSNSEIIENDAANLDEYYKDDDGVIDLSLAGKAKEGDDIPGHANDKADDDNGDQDDDFVFANKDDDDDDVDTGQDPVPTTGGVDDDVEATQVGLLFEAFAESLNWDANVDNKPKTIEDLIGYVQEAVGSADAAVQYSSEEVKELDEFIRNGGRFEDYYKANSQIVDYDSMDLEDENNQKRILTEYFKHSGFSDAQIKRKVEKYEDAGILEDEASEAVEFLKAKSKQEKEQLLVQQEQLRVQAEQEQKQFYTQIIKEIDTLQDIRGISIPKQDKQVLMDYILKPGADGRTQYQKDYEKNLTKNLLESAYFTMKGDALVKSAKNSGETSAIKRLKQSMRNTRLSSKQSMDDSTVPVWRAFENLRG